MPSFTYYLIGMKKIISTNPAKNYEIVWEVEVTPNEEILSKIEQAHEAKKSRKDLWITQRIEMLKPICQEFKNRKVDIARLITQETWKPITQSLSEAVWYVEEFEYFLENAESALAEKITHEDNYSIHKMIYEPYGVAWVITPRNFPFGMAIRWIVPNLIVWNTVVFKISEECPLVWKLIEEVISNQNLPQWVFSEIYWAWDVWEFLSKGDLDYIRFTWSTKVGHQLYQTASEKFIKVLLEMGWSNPCIVFEDADIDVSVDRIYRGRFQNCWQVCDAIKRLIVHESVLDKTLSWLKDVVESKIIGDSMNADTDIWSLVAKRQLDLIKRQFDDAVSKWAHVICWWNEVKDHQGAFFEPTILANITRDMLVRKEETFWPLLPVITFTTEEEAIELANDTIYWLWSRIITENKERAVRVSSQIKAWTVEINDWSRWLSCNPFGWYKMSWMWREHGDVWFRELCQIKVISMSK